MGWRTLSVLLFLVPPVAHASPATRAARALDAFEAGDRDALDTATRAADDAVVARRSGSDPAVWLLRGQIYFARLLHPEIPGTIDPAVATIESFEKAVALGAAGAEHARLSELVPTLEATLHTALVNDVEARAWASAEKRLQTALRARLLAERLRGREPAREVPLREIAVQITAELGKASEARTHYEAFAEASGTDDTPLACLVARAMADHGDLDGAITFVGALADKHPHDEVLLRTEVELLVRSGRIDEAVARVDRALPVLETSVSGSWLAAALYASAGEEARARASWQRVIDLDPRHVDARLALGRSLLQLGIARRSELAGRSEETEARKPSREILALVTALGETWQQAEMQLVAAHELAPGNPAPVEALIALYEARLAGRDPETRDRAVLLAIQADQQKLDAARSALAAQEGG